VSGGVNETCRQLVARMVVSTMVDRREQLWELYEQYTKERRLHATVREILEAKGYKKIA
jgi:head-tail adaptor